MCNIKWSWLVLRLVRFVAVLKNSSSPHLLCCLECIFMGLLKIFHWTRTVSGQILFSQCSITISHRMALQTHFSMSCSTLWVCLHFLNEWSECLLLVGHEYIHIWLSKNRRVKLKHGSFLKPLNELTSFLIFHVQKCHWLWNSPLQRTFLGHIGYKLCF